jgi:hypothetical protein
MNRQVSLAAKFFVTLALCLPSANALAWAEHHLLTAAALKNMGAVQALPPITVTSFDEMIAKMGFGEDNQARLRFNETILIRKEYPFAFKAGETLGQKLSALQILSTYSDEPDWLMDQELFGDDEYGNSLWRPEYADMGGKVGVPSQAFRHMYWGSWTLARPLVSLKLMIGQHHIPHFFGARGQAPDRALIFLSLSRKARSLGYEYWSLRFLACALHYIEDVSQPFHSTQVPTTKFLDLEGVKVMRKSKNGYVAAATNIIAYYHYSFEFYVAQIMANLPSGGAQPFENALGGATKPNKPVTYDGEHLDLTVIAMSASAQSVAKRTGEACISFFPALPPEYLSKDPKQFIDESWWRTTLDRGQNDSSEKRTFYNVVETMFSVLGDTIRAVVGHEI